MLKRGRTYQKANECEKAIPVYEAIPEDYPDLAEMADVYVALGECYLKVGRIEDALRSFEIVRDKFPAKRKLALERIDQVRSSRKAAEKANEPSPDSKDSAETE